MQTYIKDYLIQSIKVKQALINQSVSIIEEMALKNSRLP